MKAFVEDYEVVNAGSKEAAYALFQRTFYGLSVASGAINVSNGHVTQSYSPELRASVFEAWFDSAAWTGKEAVR